MKQQQTTPTPISKEFTPGEWRVEKNEHKFPSYSIVVGEIGEASTICTLFTAMMDVKEQQQANAALIAEAPVMYQALKDTYSLLNSGQPLGNDDLDNIYSILTRINK